MNKLTLQEAEKILEAFKGHTLIEDNGKSISFALLFEASAIVAEEKLKEEQRKDKSWMSWEEGFSETWMEINPDHGQANAKCYIKSLVDKYVALAKEEQKGNIRKAVADYMSSEGCSCCGDYEAHKDHKNALGVLLDVPKYDDDSGYDFQQVLKSSNPQQKE
jgi:excinuclease UvrABC ATPase subunit